MFTVYLMRIFSYWSGAFVSLHEKCWSVTYDAHQRSCPGRYIPDFIYKQDHSNVASDGIQKLLSLDEDFLLLTHGEECFCRLESVIC